MFFFFWKLHFFLIFMNTIWALDSSVLRNRDYQDVFCFEFKTLSWEIAIECYFILNSVRTFHYICDDDEMQKVAS